MPPRTKFEIVLAEKGRRYPDDAVEFVPTTKLRGIAELAMDAFEQMHGGKISAIADIYARRNAIVNIYRNGKLHGTANVYWHPKLVFGAMKVRKDV